MHYLHVPTGTAIAIPVPIIAFPLAGTVFVSAAYMSYPAANLLPLVGTFAFADSFLTCNAAITPCELPFVCAAVPVMSDEFKPCVVGCVGSEAPRDEVDGVYAEVEIGP